MKLHHESEYFYNESYDFYKSGEILRNSRKRYQEEGRLLGPIIYLFRHSTELLMKALIINHYLSCGVNNWEELKFEKRGITSIHSLQSLLNILVEEKIQLCGKTSRFNQLRWIISDVEKLDMDSTFFRYPMDKNKKVNDKSIERAEDIETYRNAPCCIGALLHATSSEYYDSPNIIEIEEGLYEVLTHLFQNKE